jgi:hypothetical protein
VANAGGVASWTISVATPTAAVAREYLTVAQLAALTPWSIEAIYRMMRRGVLREGVHYFQPQGVRTQLIFKWSTIVRFIEDAARAAAVPEAEAASSEKGKVLDVPNATAALQRLLP